MYTRAIIENSIEVFIYLISHLPPTSLYTNVRRYKANTLHDIILYYRFPLYSIAVSYSVVSHWTNCNWIRYPTFLLLIKTILQKCRTPLRCIYIYMVAYIVIVQLSYIEMPLAYGYILILSSYYICEEAKQKIYDINMYIWWEIKLHLILYTNKPLM